MKVVAVVVTYNRIMLLRECLDAILHQSRKVDKIILIDNASTDGTHDILQKEGYLDMDVMDYVGMKENLGGSGGFYEGIKLTNEQKADWVWIMDDDTIPEKECLEKLLDAQKKIKNGQDVSFFASNIKGSNGKPMNVPVISDCCTEYGERNYHEYLEDGMVRIKMATFVSILVNSKAVKRCGLPCRDFFIWGDDSEYTSRLIKFFGAAYLVGNSVAVHKRKLACKLNIYKETELDRIKMYHYLYRNASMRDIIYHDVMFPKLRVGYAWLKSFRYYRTKLDRLRGRVIRRGCVEALLQYPKFRQFILEQLAECDAETVAEKLL